MSFIYRNPLSSAQLDASGSVQRQKVFGTNFSVLQVGGYMEVYTLDDLKFTIPEGDTGLIEFTGNTIPINYSKRTLPFLPDNLTLNSDNISSGRRRLGMLVFVHETQTTYQYTMPNFEDLWDAASGSTTESDYSTTISTSTTGGEDFIDAWLDSSIEGVSGVTRENARWKIFYGTDWQITGGTYNSGTGTLSLENNTGGTINVTGFTTGGGSDTYVTGGTYSSGTTTLTLTRNDGNDVVISGFTSGGGGSLTLQDVTDNGSTTTNGITVDSLTSTRDITINEDITAGNGGGDISSNTVFGASALSSNSSGNANTAFGTWTLSATTGSGNSAFGSLALYTNTSGNNNTAIGKNAMYNGGNPSQNVAVGSESFYNGGGTNGIAIGYQAGYEVTSASSSILIGYRAGYDITDNDRNIAIGYESLRFNDEGTFNVAIGDTALNGNRSGDFNVGIGNDALVSNTTGLRNVGVGSDSLSNNQTGNDNVALGFEAGQNVANGNGGLNGTSNDSIFIGKGSKASVNNGTNEIVIGTDAVGNGSNTITLGNTGHTDTYLFGTIHGVPFISGGSYTNGTLTLNDANGGTINVTGFTTGGSDTYITGGTVTYNSQGTLQLSLNNDTNVDITGFTALSNATLVGDTLTLIKNVGDDIVVTGFTTVESDTFITGGTYTETTGTLSLSRNDDNNVDITGWSYVKTVTESSNVFTVTLNDNSTTSLTVDAVTGLGRNEWALSGTSTGVSAPSVELPFITGGTYSSGNLTLNINDGLETDITITGLDSDDTYLTGATYTPTTLTLGMNDGTEFSVGGFAPEITGGTLSNGTLSLLDNTNGSVDITGFTTTGNLYSADGQLESNRVVDQDSNSLTFSGGSVSMGTNTTSPVCALLELASTNQGLLIPRMTQAQRLAISSPIAGLIVYCTNSDSDGQEGLYMYKSLGWVNVL